MPTLTACPPPPAANDNLPAVAISESIARQIAALRADNAALATLAALLEAWAEQAETHASPAPAA